MRTPVGKRKLKVGQDSRVLQIGYLTTLLVLRFLTAWWRFLRGCDLSLMQGVSLFLKEQRHGGTCTIQWQISSSPPSWILEVSSISTSRSVEMYDKNRQGNGESQLNKPNFICKNFERMAKKESDTLMSFTTKVEITGLTFSRIWAC